MEENVKERVGGVRWKFGISFETMWHIINKCRNSDGSYLIHFLTLLHIMRNEE